MSTPEAPIRMSTGCPDERVVGYRSIASGRSNASGPGEFDWRGVVRHRDILLYRADVVTTVHMPTGDVDASSYVLMQVQG